MANPKDPVGFQKRQLYFLLFAYEKDLENRPFMLEEITKLADALPSLDFDRSLELGFEPWTGRATEPFIHAVRTGCPEVCKVFVQRAEKFNPRALEMDTGWTYKFGALDAAVGDMRSPEVVQAILPLFSLCEQNSFGSTPMHNIFEWGKVNMSPKEDLPAFYETNAKLLSLLFCREALGLRDVNGQTPLYKACETLDVACIALLARAMAQDLDAREWESLDSAVEWAGKRFGFEDRARDAAAALRAARERATLGNAAAPGGRPKLRGV